MIYQGGLQHDRIKPLVRRLGIICKVMRILRIYQVQAHCGGTLMKIIIQPTAFSAQRHVVLITSKLPNLGFWNQVDSIPIRLYFIQSNPPQSHSIPYTYRHRALLPEIRCATYGETSGFLSIIPIENSLQDAKGDDSVSVICRDRTISYKPKLPS